MKGSAADHRGIYHFLCLFRLIRFRRVIGYRQFAILHALSGGVGDDSNRCQQEPLEIRYLYNRH